MPTDERLPIGRTPAEIQAIIEIRRDLYNPNRRYQRGYMPLGTTPEAPGPAVQTAVDGNMEAELPQGVEPARNMTDTR